MKKFTLLTLLLCGSYFGQAQITLDHTDYNYSTTSETFDFVHFNDSSVVLPQSGADMIWDYTAGQANGGHSVIYEGISNPDFPNSNLRTPVMVRYLGIDFPTYRYHTYDTTGFRKNGQMDLSIALPLASVTGNTADTLLVIGGSRIESNPWYFFKLPMSYNQTSDVTGIGEINFIANVPTFGLNNFPIRQIIERNIVSNVEGWGKLVLMNPITAEADTFEVLLKKDVATLTTFYYDANNNLLPPTLLTPLGLTQGYSVTSDSYSFYTKGLNQFALSITVINGLIDGVAYNEQVFTNGMPISTSSVKESFVANKVYPNPIQGNQFQLEIEKNNGENWQLDIYNTLGQNVHNELVRDNISTVQLENNLPKGQYFYTVRNENGQIVANGKLMK
jgi:hypothetical protein